MTQLEASGTSAKGVKRPGGALSAEERAARGRAARKVATRGSHAAWGPAPERPDPVSLLESRAATRHPDLIAIRHSRMAASPFAFYRGSAALMAADLTGTPESGITTQLCGDAHLSNFGVFGSPERTLLFDVNDFDETLPGPWEWDVKRLAASFVVASRHAGFSPAVGREAVLAAVESYRSRMSEYADLRDLDVWYSRVTADDVMTMLTTDRMRAQTKKGLAKARSRDSIRAFAKLTTTVDGRPRIIDDPPLLVRVELDLVRDVEGLFRRYRRTLQDDRRLLLERYQLIDLAHKVVGVGSVGTECFIALLTGRDDADPLFLQIKEAESSVLERHLPNSRFSNHAQRVVAGQRLMQAASDIFLGWIRADDGRDYYWRQLHDMKGSAVIEEMEPSGFVIYGEVCGWALARAHARSGDRLAIAAYLGSGDRFARALADFAEAYADQNERDYQAMLDVIASGRIEADSGA